MRFLGIDIGNTCVKGHIFDENGTDYAGVSVPHTLMSLGADAIAIDPVTILKDIENVVRQCAAACPEISAVAVSCMAEAFTPLGPDNKPWFPCLLTQDMRGMPDADAFSLTFGAGHLKEVTGQQVNAKFTAAKIRWLSRNYPEQVRHTSCFASWLGMTSQLFGFAPHCDYGIAGKTMLFDIRNHCWDPNLLAFAGIQAEQMDIPVPAGTSLGEISDEISQKFGFHGNPTFIVGSFDQTCANIGSGPLSPQEGTLGMGTVFCMTNRLPADKYLMLPESFPAIPDIYDDTVVSTASVITGGQAYDWARNLYYAHEADMHGAIQRELPAEPSGLLFFPYLAGSGTPSVDPLARGAFLGLKTGTTRGALMKAVMEGVAYELRVNLDVIEQTSDARTLLIASGGCSRSAQWLEILSNILHKDIYVSEIADAGCLGAAMIAATGCGAYADFGEAIRHMRQPYTLAATPSPDKQEQYDKLYCVYREYYPSVIRGSRALTSAIS